MTTPPPQQRLPDPHRAEAGVVDALLARCAGLDWPAVIAAAKPWVVGVRSNPAPFWAMESLLREYPITSAEGLALMRLAEALLRVPDAETAIALTADQLGRADFDDPSDGPHKVFAALAGSAIGLSKKMLPDPPDGGGLMQRLGAKTVVAATVRAIQLLGRQFVLGRHIHEAMSEAADQRKAHAALRFSYDMLGEGARTERDAERYLAAYQGAIAAIAKHKAAAPEDADGISIKLSALFCRYEDAQRERVFATLLPRVWTLIDAAARANLNLTIDAEECDRLELSLGVLEALAARITREHPQWRGFGLAVQAYQTRALAVADEVARIAKTHGLRFMVRLVKGAYWDGEIKRAQELGLAGYPVFTHKQHTDASYLACAQALIGHADVIYPQFATHNAGTLAAIVQMAQRANAKFELQRLHGMGEGVFREFTRLHPHVPVRIYAPVGEHRDLLAYLVRRLLENGANSSFVHQLSDDEVPIDELLASPLQRVNAQALPLPAQLYGSARANATGVDLACLAQAAPLLGALQNTRVGTVAEATPDDVNTSMARLQTGFAAWSALPVQQRAATLQRAANALDAQLAPMCALLVQEAHKTWGDCVAEVREAVDFLRYYAVQAAQHAPPLQGRGVFVCISPWNFPLAIFAGQVAAALAAGNAVAAKPAEQTPFVALRMVTLLHEAGVPKDALALLHGPGETVGAQLVADARCAGVVFTGSTQVAQIIHRALAAKDGPVVPLIAETGGLNVMVVDSTALPEQVVDAVVQSAFRSAGQRCSALRVLCVHEGIADGVIEMIQGAMAELSVGDPSQLATDIGPLIDSEAHANVRRAIERLSRQAKLIAQTPAFTPSPLTGEGGGGGGSKRAATSPPPQPSPVKGEGANNFIAPVAFEISTLANVKEEIFGPVLQVLRWRGDIDALVDQINALGYGLTLGVQTRIDSRAERIADRAKVGNIYINRNMIGAVVGVQPFGGEGLSGTGPKAGGPHYLARFSASPAGAPAYSLTRPQQATGIDIHWRAMQTAQTHWAERALHERLDILSPLLPAGERKTLEQALSEQTLPGPTGEANTLRLHGRGVWAVLAEGATRLDAQAAVARCLAAGNAVLCVGEHNITLPGLPTGLLHKAPEAAIAAVLASADLAGVCVVAGDDATARPVQRALAERSGPILPLVTGAQWRRSDQLNRFAVEQTLTINTAAAGGNAALLAGVERQ
jgi:RHH-type transcriptional regulator, proline utilization regulon repressor / proline dehydrogenase / delta 1-pyrroline-5-carboxylate dehydrogenase